MRQGVLEDRLLDDLGHAIGMRVARAGQPVDQPVRAVGLEERAVTPRSAFGPGGRGASMAAAFARL
jgi:hypothetical protein